jgi:hypothetical protein
MINDASQVFDKKWTKMPKMNLRLIFVEVVNFWIILDYCGLVFRVILLYYVFTIS